MAPVLSSILYLWLRVGLALPVFQAQFLVTKESTLREGYNILSSHQARRKGAVSVSCRAFFSGYARDFFHSILLISNISFFAFNINCINKCNKNMFHTEYE